MAMLIRNTRTTWVSIVLVAAAALPAIVAIPAVLVAAVFFAPPVALAQDAALMAELAVLTRQKGYKNIPMGRETCENLGLKPIGNCRVFQEAYVDAYGFTHGFNTFTEPGSGNIRIFLFRHGRRRSYYYAPGLDGKLQRAAVLDRKRTFAWFPLHKDSATPGFDQEVSYWRIRRYQLESEPDRKD
jgi:hypothetical protein